MKLKNFKRKNNINDLKILLANKQLKCFMGKKSQKKLRKAAKETFSENFLGSNLTIIKNSKKKLIKIFKYY